MRPILTTALALACPLIMGSCASFSWLRGKGLPECPGYEVASVQSGEASWYSVRSNRGTHTASGERLKDSSSTAAHRTLPFGTKVKVTNQRNGRWEIVTINNRGPFIRGRVIDVTIGCAERLDFRHRGVAPVKLEILRKIEGRR